MLGVDTWNFQWDPKVCHSPRVFTPPVFPTLEVSDHHEAHEGTGGYPVGVARVKSQATYVEKILTLVN